MRIHSLAIGLVRVALILATLALIAALATPTAAHAADATPTTRTVKGTPNEDEPGYMWSTMGNRKRGVVTMHGTPMVVGPCKFARMMSAGTLRYTVRVNGRTYRTLSELPGDAWALAHGCERYAR